VAEEFGDGGDVLAVADHGGSGGVAQEVGGEVGITLDVYSHVTATIKHQSVNALDDLLAVRLAVNRDGQGQNRS
jgi:hypothetical protein